MQSVILCMQRLGVHCAFFATCSELLRFIHRICSAFEATFGSTEDPYVQELLIDLRESREDVQDVSGF